MKKMRIVFSLLIVLFLVSTLNITTSNAQDSTHYIYGAAWGPGKIQRTTLDGSNIEDLVTGLKWPRDVALDIAGNKMYWVDAGANKVQRANLDGTNVQNLVNAQGRPFGIAVDTTSGKMYWSIWGPGKIRRANLDGTNVEDFITGLREPEDIDLDLSEGKIYWTDTVTNKIQRANLDGSNIEDLVTEGLSHPLGLTLDVAGGKIYWTNTSFWPWGGPGVDKIRRANLDGTNVEDLVTTGFAAVAHGIVLDVSAGKMYWTDGGKIRRANLDGSNVEDAITGIGATGIAIGILQPNTVRPPDVTTTTKRPPDVTTTTTTTVSFSPSPVQSPAVNERLTFSLRIANGVRVAGYQATVQFDTTTLRYVSSANSNYLPAGAFSGQPVVEGNLVKINAASLTGESKGNGTLATLTFEIIAVKASSLTLSEVLLSNSDGETSRPQVQGAEITTSRQLRGDVNADGAVNVLDLVLVASRFGQTGENAADVNGDKVVNIADLVLVAGALGGDDDANNVGPILVAGALGGNASPSLHPRSFELLTVTDVKQWLSQAQDLPLTDITSQRGIHFLEQLLLTLTPKETELLANYPNPFNPETWIPYQLSNPADVAVHIYGINGTLVRYLPLGYQAAGMYRGRSRAAYWDGKNAVGEPVASGVYFYTLIAGDYTATRKMLIRK